MEKISYLILDYNRPEEGEILLNSIHQLANHDKEIVYLVNGGESDYAIDFYKKGLIDTLIIKKNGDGGGFGQTDLFKFCKTKYAFFVQVDHILVNPIDNNLTDFFIKLLETDYKCIDVNGDQSGKGIWTDRAHFIDVDFFNNLGPFPNFGPGNEDGQWNEEYLQNKFINNNYQIAHISPLLFLDNGKWSVRESGDGIYKHRCDTKELYIIKTPTYKTEIYPPLNETEWELVLNNKWVDGQIPEKWKNNSFKYWNN